MKASWKGLQKIADSKRRDSIILFAVGCERWQRRKGWKGSKMRMQLAGMLGKYSLEGVTKKALQNLKLSK